MENKDTCSFYASPEVCNFNKLLAKLEAMLTSVIDFKFLICKFVDLHKHHKYSSNITARANNVIIKLV